MSCGLTLHVVDLGLSQTISSKLGPLCVGSVHPFASVSVYALQHTFACPGIYWRVNSIFEIDYLYIL